MAVLKDIADLVHDGANLITTVIEYRLTDRCRQIESGVTRAALGIGFLKICFLVLVAGLGLLLWGLYQFLTSQIYPPTAAIILGGVVLLAGLIVCRLVVLTAPKNNVRG